MWWDQYLIHDLRLQEMHMAWETSHIMNVILFRLKSEIKLIYLLLLFEYPLVRPYFAQIIQVRVKQLHNSFIVLKSLSSQSDAAVHYSESAHGVTWIGDEFHSIALFLKFREKWVRSLMTQKMSDVILRFSVKWLFKAARNNPLKDKFIFIHHRNYFEKIA